MKTLNRTFLLFLSVCLILFGLWYFRGIVGYLVAAWVLSLLGKPIMKFYQKIPIYRWHFGNNVAAALTIVTLFTIVAAFFALFVPLILEQARTLASIDYLEISKSLEEPINRMNQSLIKAGLLDPQKTSPIEKFQADALAQVNDLVSRVFGSVISITTNLFIGLFSVVFIMFFFLKDEALLLHFLYAFVPNEQETRVGDALSEIQHLLTRYFGGILLQMSIITFIVSVGLTFVGIENAFLIGFFAALINVVPYLGPLIGGTFGLLMAIASNMDMEFYSQMFPMLIKVFSVFCFVQLVDNFILQPFIFSASVRAHPLEIFIIIFVGAELYGIVGMVLAIPTYTVLRVVARTFLIQFKLVQKLTQRMTEAYEKSN